MFTQLQKVSRHKPLFSNLLGKFKVQQSTFRVSQLQRQFGAPTIQTSYHRDRDEMIRQGQNGFVPDVDRNKFSQSVQIEDFEVNYTSIKNTIDFTPEMTKIKHPLEYMAKTYRLEENAYTRMNQNCIYITNFPKDINVTQEYIKNLCLEKGDRNALFKRIEVKQAMTGDGSDFKQRTAYAIVEFEQEKSAAQVRRGLRKQWIHDSLLKVKTLADLKNEGHADRTVVVAGLASHYRPADVVNVLNNFGAVTSIELPTVDQLVQHQLEEKGLLNDYHTRARQQKKDQEWRYAQVVLQDTQRVDAEFENILKQTWGEEKAKEVIKKQKDVDSQFTKFDMLDEERVQSFTRVMMNLQAEGLQIENSKSTIGVLVKDLESRQQINSAPKLNATNSSLKDHQNAIESKKAQIQGTLAYLMANKESLDESQAKLLDLFTNLDTEALPSSQTIGSIDPIHKLQRMTLGEITRAYDQLLAVLNHREQLIKHRIKSSLKHFGTEERILFESENYSREQESIPDVMRNILRMHENSIDEYLGVNEQIQNVNAVKHFDVEEKLYQWMTNTLDFNAHKNFNQHQLTHANNLDLERQREQLVPSRSKTLSQVRAEGPTPQPFRDEYLEKITSDVKRARDQLDLPFDEIYHKERKLVQDIIRAQKAIEEIQAKQVDPADGYKFDPKDIDEDPVFGDMYLQSSEPQFIRDKRARERVETLQATRQIEYAEVDHQYRELEKQTIQDLMSAGQINREEFETAKARSLENRHMNLGYALVTFSHSDEAKKATTFTGGEFYINSDRVDIFPKGNVDHSELDRSYFMKKLYNDAQVADQKQDLRDAKAKLRDFETNIDKELPALKKLKEFRSLAQEMIENPKYKTRRHKSNRRTKRETEELYEKMKEYEAANPGVNLTSLFESEALEKSRALMHKRAFQSYKNFEFLKAGINQTESKKPERADVFEAYNYPGLRDTVESVLTGGIQTKVRDAGGNSMRDSSTKQRLGRRFDRYTEQEFLESYLGKDYARAIDLGENEDNYTFRDQKTIAELFPDRNEFLRYPQLLEEEERLKNFMGVFRQDGEALDPEFARFLKQTDGAKFFEEQVLDDRAHPTDSSRTMIGDLRKAIKIIEEKQEKRGKPNEMDARDLRKAFTELGREYRPASPFEEADGDAKFAAYADSQVAKIDKLLDGQRGPEAEQARNWDQPEEVWKNMLAKVLEGAEEYNANIPVDADQADSDNWSLEKILIDEDPGFTSKTGTGKGGPRRQGQDSERRPMFSPTSRAKFSTKNTPPAENDEPIEGFYQVSSNFGSGEKLRQSNENIYNLEQLEKKNWIDPNSVDLKDYKEMAAHLTKEMRKEFGKARKEQLKLPKEERIPHYIDSEGQINKYTNEQLATATKYRDEKRKRLGMGEYKENEPKDNFNRTVSPDGFEWPQRDQPDKNHPNYAIQQMFDDILMYEPEEAIKDMSISDYVKLFKSEAPFNQTVGQGNNNTMFKYQQTFMDESDLAKHEFRTQNTEYSRTLEEFQDNESSIYDEYRRQESPDLKTEKMMEEANLELLKQQKLREIYNEVKENFIEAPDLKSYFEQQAQGKSAYGKFETQEYEDRESQEAMNRLLEEQEDESTYRKELLARMYGGKLTARQYGVLMNKPEHDATESREFNKLFDYKTMMKSRDEIRNVEEIVESYRRQQVHKGIWTEVDSYRLLQETLNELHAKYPTKKQYDIAVREEKRKIEMSKDLSTMETLNEREYYFDEGLGESLNDHTSNLKKQFEGIDIQTRRDRDGLALVKLSFTPKFKYNLDEILNQDPQEMKRIELENHEAIISSFFPSDPRELMESLNNKNLSSDYLNQKGLELTKNLMQQRFFGKYKNDLDGFIEQLQLIKKNCSGKGSPALVPGIDNYDPLNREQNQQIERMALRELEKDSELFAWEIQYQMKLKHNQKLNFEKRKESDFVKHGRSENVLYREQVTTLEETTRILEKDNEWLLNAGDTNSNNDDDKFDLEAYKELKRSIQERRTIKEKILHQGFPEFKPYLRL